MDVFKEWTSKGVSRAALTTSNLPDERQARDIVFTNVQNPRKRTMAVLTLADCQAIKATMNKKKSAYNAAKCWNNTFTAMDIDVMLKIHQLHKMKRDAATIKKWLDASLDIPSQHIIQCI